MADSKKRWYQQSWVCVACLILFFPIGLFLMWRYQPWKNASKFSISLLAVLVVIVSFMLPPYVRLSSLALPTTPLTLEVSEGKVIKPFYTPRFAQQTLLYQSEDPSVACFDGDKLVAVKEGQTKVFVQNASGTIKSNGQDVYVVDSDLAQKEKAAQKVINQIDEIGTVDVNSLPAIVKAQKAYDKLSIGEKDLVSNIGLLTKAYQTYQNLEKESTSFSSKEKKEMVYVTSNGTKYHQKTCSYLSKDATAIPKQEAIDKGKRPCQKCNPS